MTYSSLAGRTLTFCVAFATASAVGVVPSVTRDAQAREPGILVGSGTHTYRWVRNWLKLPANMVIGPTHGDVAVDAGDRIYFSTDTANAIFVVDGSGRVLRVFGADVVKRPHGMRLVRDAGDEVLWVADIGRNEVLKLSLDGKILSTIAYPSDANVYAKASEFVPTAVDVAPNGDVYVADGYGKGWVHQFDASGRRIRSWNGDAGAAGKFNQPHGIGIDLRGPEPRVVVADRQNHRLQLFKLDGAYVDAVTADLRLPSKITVRGRDMVVSDLQGRVTVFDSAYQVVAQIGDNTDPELRGKFNVAPAAWRDGELTAPHGAAWDSKGNLYIEDWNAFGRVSKLERVRARR